MEIKNASSLENKFSWFCFPAIAFLVIIVYFPTFTGGFILDDRPLIENNSYITETHSIVSYLSQEDGISDGSYANDYHTGYYRPLVSLTYRMDYKLWGMKACGFRITNLVLHLLSCIVLFKLLVLLAHNRWTAFMAVAIFAIHPVNTESVSWIISRNNILVTLFILLSLYFYIVAWIENNRIIFLIAIFFFLCAVLSKEFAIMLLPVFFLCHRFLFEKKGGILKESTTYLPFVLIVVFYFILRHSVTGSVLTPFDINDFWQRVYFIPYIIVWNLKLIFLPWKLHSFSLSYPDSYLSWSVLSSIVLFLLICMSVWFVRRRRLLLFSGLSSLFFMFPVLNVIPTASVSLVAMRWMYLPMAFISISVVLVIGWTINCRRVLAVTILCVVISYLCAYSFILNKYLWHDEKTFFDLEVRRFNNNLYAGALAESLLEQGKYHEAKKYFLTAIETYPREAINYINYSALLIDTGRCGLALSYLNKAEEFVITGKEKKQLLNNMGVALTYGGKPDEAADNLRRALELDPGYTEAHNNMGVVLLNQGKVNEAISHFRKAIRIKKDYTEAKNNLKVALNRQNKNTGKMGEK